MIISERLHGKHVPNAVALAPGQTPEPQTVRDIINQTLALCNSDQVEIARHGLDEHMRVEKLPESMRFGQAMDMAHRASIRCDVFGTAALLKLVEPSLEGVLGDYAAAFMMGAFKNRAANSAAIGRPAKEVKEDREMAAKIGRMDY